MCKRDENRAIRNRCQEAMRHAGKKCLLSDPIADDSLGRGHAGGRPDEALKDAAREDMLIIEDDYNSEFRYYNRPTPSCRAFRRAGRRVSGDIFKAASAIDSHELHGPAAGSAETVSGAGRFYNQTASKAEQIALCQFIRDGHRKAGSGKSKKLYAAKAKCLCGCGAANFWRKARTHLGDAGFLVLMELDSPLTSAEIAGRAAQAGRRPPGGVGRESLENRSIIFKRDIRSSCCPVLRWGRAV